jgi:predicted RNA binding protein YcfA (HicA-like mRNA interferase family)
MSEWPSMNARRVLAALQRIGWTIKRVASPHQVLARDGWPDTVFAFHDGEDIGPRMLARIAKRCGVRQAGTALAHGARPAACSWLRYSRAQRWMATASR